MARALFREDRATVGIYWVPGHHGVYGNDVVDSLAKAALHKPPCPEAYTSFSHIKRLVKARALQQWRDLWEGEASKPRPRGLGRLYQLISQDSLRFSFEPLFLQLPRMHQSAYIQLKTGVGFIQAYQHTIKKAASATCFGDCNSRQTTQHLLLECRTFNTHRATLRQALVRARLPVTLQSLFNTTKGREALQAFLHTTRICTAKWYYYYGAIDG
jgi:hypothetical protein